MQRVTPADSVARSKRHNFVLFVSLNPLLKVCTLADVKVMSDDLVKPCQSATVNLIVSWSIKPLRVPVRMQPQEGLMDEFATKGTVQVGDAMAALALIRGLIRALEKRRALSRNAVSSIINDALAQLEDI